jgi:thiamine biosynthesis lipoprotein
MSPGLRRVEHIMGTAVSLHIGPAVPAVTAARVAERTFDWLREVDRRFSTYQDDSEVTRLDRGGLRHRDCSADLRAVLDACADLWRATGGWFDPYATGRLDPSGYVKGWAVQVASDRLLEAGAVDHCLNAGGDVRVRGDMPEDLMEPGPDLPGGQVGWRVGIRHPWQPHQVCWVLAGRDLAVATSGCYERGRHVIDPFRGEPPTGLCSVTMVGSDLGLADGYATAALAMGRAGLRWLAGLDGYEWGAITDDGEAYRSAGLPVAPTASVLMGLMEPHETP